MADRLMQAVQLPAVDAELAALLRLEPLRNERAPDVLTFSGGVSEYIYGREGGAFGDLGPALARAVLARAQAGGRASSSPTRASAPPWSAPRNTRSRSAAARSTSRRPPSCRSRMSP